MTRAELQQIRTRAKADRLPRLALEVYVALVRYDAMGRAEPAVTTIADELGASERGVRKALRRLEAGGWIATEQRLRQTSVYELRVWPGRGNGVPPQRARTRGNAGPEQRSPDLSPTERDWSADNARSRAQPAVAPDADAGAPAEDQIEDIRRMLSRHPAVDA